MALSMGLLRRFSTSCGLYFATDCAQTRNDLREREATYTGARAESDEGGNLLRQRKQPYRLYLACLRNKCGDINHRSWCASSTSHNIRRDELGFQRINFPIRELVSGDTSVKCLELQQLIV